MPRSPYPLQGRAGGAWGTCSLVEVSWYTFHPVGCVALDIQKWGWDITWVILVPSPGACHSYGCIQYSRGRVTEGRRQFWYSKKSTDFRICCEMRREYAPKHPSARLFHEWCGWGATHCQGLGQLLGYNYAKEVSCLPKCQWTVGHLPDVLLTPQVLCKIFLCRGRAEGDTGAVALCSIMLG